MEIGRDKYLHFGVCLVAGLVDTGLALGLAIGKEYGDAKAVSNHFCHWDILADLLGLAVGTLARVLIMGRFTWWP